MTTTDETTGSLTLSSCPSWCGRQHGLDPDGFHHDSRKATFHTAVDGARHESVEQRVFVSRFWNHRTSFVELWPVPNAGSVKQVLSTAGEARMLAHLLLAAADVAEDSSS